jgi:hypothetical protein
MEKNPNAVALGKLGRARNTPAQQAAARRAGLAPVRPGNRPRGNPSGKRNH